MFFTLPLTWQGGRQCNLQLSIQPCICEPGTHFCWVYWGIVWNTKLAQCLYAWPHWEVNPRPSGLVSNALCTWLRATMLKLFMSWPHPSQCEWMVVTSSCSLLPIGSVTIKHSYLSYQKEIPFNLFQHHVLGF